MLDLQLQDLLQAVPSSEGTHGLTYIALIAEKFH